MVRTEWSKETRAGGDNALNLAARRPRSELRPQYGVVLRIPRGEGSPHKFDRSPDVFYEQAILIRGPVCGALIC